MGAPVYGDMQINLHGLKKKKGEERESRATPASVSVGRRSLTPHCLGGARSLPALCPRNVCSGRGGNREALPEKAREKPPFSAGP